MRHLWRAARDGSIPADLPPLRESGCAPKTVEYLYASAIGDTLGPTELIEKCTVHNRLELCEPTGVLFAGKSPKLVRMLVSDITPGSIGEMKHLISLLVGTLALALATPVQAYVISQGSTLGFSWSSPGGGFNLAGTGTITASNLSQPSGGDPGSMRLNVTLTNTTTTVLSDGKDARLTSWGFGIDPNVTQVTFSDSADTTGMTGAMLGDLPSLKMIEVCVFGGNNCNGGANDGIYGGGRSDSFVLTMEGQFGQSVTLNPFGFRYQTSNSSFEFACDTPANGSTTTVNQLTCGTPPPPNRVSEPGILALLAAVGIAGSVGRHRARARTAAV